MTGQPGDNTRLQGHYTYTLGGQFSGLASGNGYQRAGTFIADGKGHLTGTDDLVQSGAPITSSLTGTYLVSSDGTGLMVLTIGSQQLQWAFALTSDSEVALIEFDAFASGAGGAFAQNTGAITATPAGTFIFRTGAFQANNGVNTQLASLGSLTVSNGSITGNEDLVRNGVFSSPTIVTGSLTPPDATGKGTIAFSDSSGFAPAYFYYVIDSATLNLLETDSDAIAGNNLGGGRALLQTGGPFDNSSLNGQFVFSSSGDTLSGIFRIDSVGAFTSDGQGNISAGSYDAVVDGSPISNAALTGSYSIAANGRTHLTLNTAATGSLPEIAWLASPSKLFYLVDIPGRTEGGTLYPQQADSVSNSSLNGQFSFSMFGGDNQSPSEIDRVGVASFGGNATFTMENYFINRGGSRNQTSAPGVAYTLGSNGRVTISIPGISDNLVMYMVSNSAGYMILEDPSTEVAGSLAQQVTP